MEPSKIIGKNIQLQTEAKGIKQEILAKHLGISKSRLSQIKHGDCRELTLNRMQTIASYIEIDFFTLVYPQKIDTQ